MTEHVSAKVKRPDNERAERLAAELDTTRSDVITMALDLAEAASPRRRHQAIEQVLQRYPRPYRRLGRGNRRPAA